MSDKILEADFDHPCRGTCSGWQQGFDRGQFESRTQISALSAKQLLENPLVRELIQASKDLYSLDQEYQDAKQEGTWKEFYSFWMMEGNKRKENLGLSLRPFTEGEEA